MTSEEGPNDPRYAGQGRRTQRQLAAAHAGVRHLPAEAKVFHKSIVEDKHWT